MIAAAEARKVWTEAELQALPHDREQVMPGFQFPVADLFIAEDWD